MDDMLVKSWREEDHLEDLKEMFDTLRSYNMKLRKMCFRSDGGKIARVYGVAKGDRSKPG